MRRLLLGLLSVILVYLTLLTALRIMLPTQPPHAPPALAQQMRIIAHQGGDGIAPGNTLTAFHSALALGADTLEFDVHLTKDQQLVVIHDDTLARTTDGTGKVATYTFIELKRLDAAYNWRGSAGEMKPFRGQDIHIPSVQEVFHTFPEMPMIIEIKPASGPAPHLLCQQIRAHKMSAKVVVGSFHDAAIKAFRTACPEVISSMSQAEVTQMVLLNVLGLGNLYNPTVAVAQVPVKLRGLSVINRPFLKLAKRKGIVVQAWTINSHAQMAYLLRLGVDGLITDYPNRALEAFESVSSAR